MTAPTSPKPLAVTDPIDARAVLDREYTSNDDELTALREALEGLLTERDSLRADFPPDLIETAARALSGSQHPGVQAYIDARRVLSVAAGSLRAEAWRAGWGAGYTDRHREHIGDDGHVVRIEVTPNPFEES